MLQVFAITEPRVEPLMPTVEPTTPLPSQRADHILDDTEIERRRHGLPGDLLALCRLAQWPKNVVVAVPALANASVWKVDSLWRLAGALGMFIVASGLVYVLNDVADRNRDRAHPVKRHRPIASGRISLPAALVFATVLAATLTASVIVTAPSTWWPLMAYLALNLAYSHALKHVSLVEIFVVAGGFVLRLVQGCVAVGAQVSPWLLVCVFTGCLLLVLGKRRHEITGSGARHRPALRGYSIQLVDHLILLSATLTAAAYLLYLGSDAAFGAPGAAMALTSAPFALFGIFRYLQVLFVFEGGADPVRTLLYDRVMIANFALWIVCLTATALLSAHDPDALSSITRKVA